MLSAFVFMSAEVLLWGLGATRVMQRTGAGRWHAKPLVELAIALLLIAGGWCLVRAERHRRDGDTIGWPRSPEYAPLDEIFTRRGWRLRRAGSILVHAAVVIGPGSVVWHLATGA